MRFITGNSISSRRRAFSRRASESASKSPAAHFRSTTAIPAAAVPSCRATSWDWRRSTQIVYHDAKHPAALYLPVIEDGAHEHRRASCRWSNSRTSSKRYGSGAAGARRHQPERRQGRIRQHDRAIGLRQIDGAEIDLGTDAADQRLDSRGRHGAERRARNRLVHFSGRDVAALAHRGAERRARPGTRRRGASRRARKRQRPCSNSSASRTWRNPIRASFRAA